MKDITHRVPDKNQAAYARENGIDGDKLCMIARDFSKNIDEYSDERRAQLTAYQTI
jgi:hypothetical protein